MYKKLETIIPHDDEFVQIWRYTDFTKFASLLDKKSLYFTEFRKFEDPFEGQFPDGNRIETMEKLEKGFEGNQQMLEYLHNENPIDRSTKDLHSLGSYYISCWHENEYESAAMWKLYSDQEKGIAIQSNFKNLCDCFSVYEPEVIIGKVMYIDYKKDSIPWGNGLKIFKPFMYKRRSFIHEQEIRAMVYIRKGEKNEKKDGIYVPVSLNKLIEKIYVSPKSPEWFFDLVKSITKKYRLNKEIIKSDLYKDKLF